MKMNKLTKAVILFAALLLPVLIFVFLKMFGNNQFEIPVYNHTEISEGVDCDDVKLPHTVGDLEADNILITTSSIASIYHIYDTVDARSEMKGLMKVKDRMQGQSVAIYSIGKYGSTYSMARHFKKYQVGGMWQIYQVEESVLNDFIKCQLMITGDESLVLVDQKGTIRGYYNSKDGEETDRLILESKILLYKAEDE